MGKIIFSNIITGFQISYDIWKTKREERLVQLLLKDAISKAEIKLLDG